MSFFPPLAHIGFAGSHRPHTAQIERAWKCLRRSITKGSATPLARKSRRAPRTMLAKSALAVGAAGGRCDRKRFELPAPLSTEWRLSSDRKRDAKALDVRRRDEYALPTYVALVCLAPSRALWKRRSHQDRKHAARILPRSARCYQRTGTATRPARLLTGTTTALTGDMLLLSL